MTATGSTTWKVGDVILDQYEVTDILGEGGMGRVYKVHHRGWNIDLAVKSPRPEIFARTEGKENFIREAETWVNLGLHPNIVSCYYVRTLDDIPRVFAEYVAGGSLADWIRKRRLYAEGHKLALERMLDVAIQFAWGLEMAHKRGLVHQDVKPGNVMMTTDGSAKVTDFGLAKARTMAGEGVPSGGGAQSILVSWKGMTQAYCSPEQAARKPLSRKTDIWSWGVSILEMFVGGVTWMLGALAEGALADYLQRGPENSNIPAMPPALAVLLTRCFQQRPDDRPTSMAEVAETLLGVYADEIGQWYPREVPRPAEALADSLNNRALSLFDLGKGEEASQVWKQALQADPHHLEAIHNWGVVRWRGGELTDDLLVQLLEEARATQGERWQANYYLAQVHVERGDVDAALPLLKEVVLQAPEEAGVQELLRQVQSGAIPAGRQLSIFEGHTDWVESVVLSADGHVALSGSRDKTMRLWEVATGTCLRVFQGHEHGVNSVRLSADGRLALSGSSDKTMRLWEVATGTCLRVFQGHRYGVGAVDLSADARFALSMSSDDPVRLWEVATGTCLRTFKEGHFGWIESVSLSADGRLALTGGQDRTIRLWETATGNCLRVFQGHTGKIRSLSLSADGRLALSGSMDDTMRLWEVATGTCLRVFQGHRYSVESVSLSADGRLALTNDVPVRVWEVVTGSCLRTFRESRVEATHISADGRLALSGGSWDRTVRLWQIPDRRFFCPLHPSQVWSHSDISHFEAQANLLLQQAEQALEENRFVTALSLAQQIRKLPGYERTPGSRELWVRLSLHCPKVTLRAGWLAKTFEEHTGDVLSVSAAGHLALSGWHWDKTVRLWEVATGRQLRTFEGHTGGVGSVYLSADGRLALSGGQDGTVDRDRTVRLWQVATGECLRVFEGHTGWIESVGLSADGQLALSGSRDSTVRLWQVATGECLRVFEGHTGGVGSVGLSADGRLVLSGSGKTVHVWEVATGTCLRVLQGHTEKVNSASLSADGRLVLSGSDDKTVRVWEVATGTCLRVLQGHTGSVGSVCLSTDGRFAFSGSDDKTVRAWEVATGTCLRVFQGQGSGVKSVRLSADGRFAFSASYDKTLLWELDWELAARDPAEWDEGALPYLETFLTLHTPYAQVLPQDHAASEQELQQVLTRQGRPIWNEQNFWELIRHLQRVGYGWLRPEGVRSRLLEMTASWQGSSSPPGT